VLTFRHHNRVRAGRSSFGCCERTDDDAALNQDYGLFQKQQHYDQNP